MPSPCLTLLDPVLPHLYFALPAPCLNLLTPPPPHSPRPPLLDRTTPPYLAHPVPDSLASAPLASSHHPSLALPHSPRPCLPTPSLARLPCFPRPNLAPYPPRSPCPTPFPPCLPRPPHPYHARPISPALSLATRSRCPLSLVSPGLASLALPLPCLALTLPRPCPSLVSSPIPPYPTSAPTTLTSHHSRLFASLFYSLLAHPTPQQYCPTLLSPYPPTSLPTLLCLAHRPPLSGPKALCLLHPLGYLIVCVAPLFPPPPPSPCPYPRLAHSPHLANSTHATPCSCLTSFGDHLPHSPQGSLAWHTHKSFAPPFCSMHCLACLVPTQPCPRYPTRLTPSLLSPRHSPRPRLTSPGLPHPRLTLHLLIGRDTSLGIPTQSQNK